ncbi:MAG: sigma factor-like helix-turn-helix DNA-binding protein [Polyangiaceae bacterium]
MDSERRDTDSRAQLCADVRDEFQPASECVAADESMFDFDDALERAVRDAVASVLTQRQRLLIELHFFEGRSQGEIARELGVTQQVIQKQIYGVIRSGRRVGGALAKLRQALAPKVTRHG